MSDGTENAADAHATSNPAATVTLEVAASQQAQAPQSGSATTASVDPLSVARFDAEAAIGGMKRYVETLLASAHDRIAALENAVSDLLAEHTETAGTVASHGKLFDKLASAAGSIRNAMGI